VAKPLWLSLCGFMTCLCGCMCGFILCGSASVAKPLWLSRCGFKTCLCACLCGFILCGSASVAKPRWILAAICLDTGCVPCSAAMLMCVTRLTTPMWLFRWWARAIVRPNMFGVPLGLSLVYRMCHRLLLRERHSVFPCLLLF
jgi:hypothetical protein